MGAGGRGRRGRRLAALLPALLGLLPALRAMPARADVGPPVIISMPRDSPVAVAGRTYEGVFEVRVLGPGILERFEISGEGWSILESDLPEEGYCAAPGTLFIRFRARPRNPDAPIGLALRHDRRPVRRTFALGPEAAARRGARHGVERRAISPTTIGPRSGAAPLATDSEGTIRVVGRFVYDRTGRQIDFDGDGTIDKIIPPATIGVDSIRVRLLDNDLAGSETIWEGFTSPYGHFDSGEVPWDDCDLGCDDPDLILEFVADTGVVDVTDNSLTEDTYFWPTPEILDFTGTFLDYGTLAPDDPSVMPALHIFNSIVRTHRFIATQAGFDAPKVQVEWPDTSGNNAPAYYLADEIFVGEIGQWSEATHAHEFGHHFMAHFAATVGTDYCNGYCDGDEVCTSGQDCEDPGHCDGCPENDHDAWNEGWPTWLADIVTRWMEATFTQDDGSLLEVLYPRSGESVGLCCQDAMRYTSQALDVEAFVSALLRDIEDDNLDLHDWTTPVSGSGGVMRDMTCLGVDEIFDVMTTTFPTTAAEFMGGFLFLYPEHAADLRFTARNVAEDYEAAAPLPPDTQIAGPVVDVASPTHPLGVGGTLPCITVTWEAPDDDSNGVCSYAFDWSTSADVTVSQQPNDVGTLGCRLATTAAFPTLGPRYFGIRSAECGFPLVAEPAVFGPFTILDCNGSGLVDVCDISCNHMGYEGCSLDPDACSQPGCGASLDCNDNLVPDECDVVAGTSQDCNENLVPDECELMKNWGGGFGTWGTAAAWVQGAVPASGDHVCIQDPGAQVRVSYTEGSTSVPILASDENFRIAADPGSAAHLTLTQPSWVRGDLTLVSNNSVLTVDDRLDVSGLFNWTGSSSQSSARLAGAGQTHAHGGLTIPSGVVHLDDHDLYLEAGTTSTMIGRISALNAANLIVEPGATLDYQGTAALMITGGALEVRGTLTKSTAGGTTGIEAFLRNDGVVRVQSGRLDIRSGSETTGSFLGDPGTTLGFDCGVHDLLAGSDVIAERVDFYGGSCGTATVSGRYEVSAATTKSSTSALVFAAGAEIVDYGADLLLTAGSTTFDAVAGQTLLFDNITASNAHFNSGDPIVTENLTLVSNTVIDGPSSVTVNGAMSWVAGATISGPGVTRANGTLTLGSGGAQRNLTDRTLEIAGTATLNGGFVYQGDSTVHNLAGGVIDVRSVANPISGGSTRPFQNDGTVIKTAGTGTSTITPMTTSTGLIEVRTGTLAFRRLTQTAGEVRLDGGHLAMTEPAVAPLDLAGGSLTGTGTVTGAVSNTGGAVEPGLSAGTLTLTHGYTQVAPGALAIELGGPTPGSAYDQLVLTGGAAVLDGPLRIELIDGYVPPVGATFDVLLATTVSGAFDTLEPIGFPPDRDVRVIPSTTGVRLEVFNPACDGLVSGGLAACPEAICPVIAYTPPGEPSLSFVRAVNCPLGNLLPGNVDVISARVSALGFSAGTVDLGPVTPVFCGGALGAFLWDGIPPGVGEADIFLVRAQGAADYGSASTGEPRIAGPGDCP